MLERRCWREGMDDKRRGKGRRRIFFSSSFLPPVTSVSSLTPLLLTSHSSHHLLFITLRLSVCSRRLHVHRHTQTLMHIYMFSSATIAKKKLHTHTAALSRSVWHNQTLFHFKKSWLQGRHHVFLHITRCLTLSVSIHPSPPGRLDYKSALVRPGDVVTQVISFTDCPSICPPTHPYVRSTIRFLELLSVHLFTQTRTRFNTSLSISHLALCIYFYFFTSLLSVTLSPPWLILPHSCPVCSAVCLSGTCGFMDKSVSRGDVNVQLLSDWLPAMCRSYVS